MTKDAHIVLAVGILNSLSAEDERVFKFNDEVLVSGKCEVDIVVLLLPFLGEVVHDVEDGKSEIGLAGS